MSTLKKKKNNVFTEADMNEKNIKVRINTYIDLDIVKELKKEAKKKGLGYQTLLNQVLRESIFKQENLEKRIAKIERHLKLVN